jgi:hypothetical protein
LAVSDGSVRGGGAWRRSRVDKIWAVGIDDDALIERGGVLREAFAEPGCKAAA